MRIIGQGMPEFTSVEIVLAVVEVGTPQRGKLVPSGMSGCH